MGATPRSHRYQIPMSTRNSDVQQLAQCPGSWLLKHVHEDEQAEATYFELGSALHEGIEHTIKKDWDLDQALFCVTERIGWWFHQLDSQPIETSSRGVNSIIDDADRMMRSWFKWVHPDSDKRHPYYDFYNWPPKVEVPFTRTHPDLEYPVWGSIDAIFSNDGGHMAVVDWKSGTSRQRDSNQLHFYMFGFDAELIEDAWFHHLDRKQKRSVIQEADPYPGDRVVLRRIQQAEREKEQIVGGGPVQFNPDWWCGFCTVAARCPVEGEERVANKKALKRHLQLVRPLVDITPAA